MKIVPTHFFVALALIAVGVTGCQPSTTTEPAATATETGEHAHSGTEKCEWCQVEFAKGEVITKGGKITCKACAEFH